MHLGWESCSNRHKQASNFFPFLPVGAKESTLQRLSQQAPRPSQTRNIWELFATSPLSSDQKKRVVVHRLVIGPDLGILCWLKFRPLAQSPFTGHALTVEGVRCFRIDNATARTNVQPNLDILTNRKNPWSFLCWENASSLIPISDCVLIEASLMTRLPALLMIWKALPLHKESGCCRLWSLRTPLLAKKKCYLTPPRAVKKRWIPYARFM